MARQEITSGTTKKFLEDINKNFKELYKTSEDLNNSIDGSPDIMFGDSTPDNSVGKDGDIYIQYEK